MAGRYWEDCNSILSPAIFPSSCAPFWPRRNWPCRWAPALSCANRSAGKLFWRLSTSRSPGWRQNLADGLDASHQIADREAAAVGHGQRAADDRLAARVLGRDNHGGNRAQVRILTLDAQYFKAVHVRHDQVEHQGIGPPLAQQFERP